MNRGKLPEGWADTQLGNIIELKYGKSLAAQTRDGFGFPVYGSNGVVGKHSIPLINKSGLIVGRKGSYGVVNKSVGPFFPIDTTYYIDDFYNQPLEFLFYYLSYLPLTELNRSTAIPGLNRDDAYNLDIILPPLAEQKIIAEKLDTLLAQVDSTKARLEQIPQILKRFRQAVLAAATNGKLIEHNKQSLVQWTTNPLKYLFTCIDGDRGPNYPKKNDYLTEGHCLFLSTKNVRYFGFNFDEKVFIDEEKDRLLKKGKLARNDLIITTRGTLGNVASYDETIPYDNVRINSGMLILRKKQEENCNDFLKILIASPIFQKEIQRKKTGSAQPQLPANILKEFLLSIPPVEEQHEIVRRVEQLFAYADTIEKQVNNALARVNSLTQSILAKAFRGELTAQWRAENPDLISGENSAAALLEKIKAERAASGGKKTSRKKS
ncbi:restriction endonuclease subunit S [Klebsiella michiganensis]|uniref:restriction endonuclease subunit S n=1 Tax=Klebsiella michiganensis TaxID=1134687 RepID=UPI002DBD90DF|nr:restriction endonuclease subunit S [Klebsiella michiganensis]MEB8292175.1 restriction endonuclease subunit S [Klebsiella michiganensis]